MKRRVLIIAILFATAFSSFAQIEDELANYQLNRELMGNARDYIMDKVLDGDFAKVKDAKDYAVALKDETVSPFSCSELWSIMFLTNEFETMNVLRMTLDWLENGAGRMMTSEMHNHAVAHLAVNPDSKYKWSIENMLMVESLPNRSTSAPSFRHRNVWSIGYLW